MTLLETTDSPAAERPRPSPGEVVLLSGPSGPAWVNAYRTLLDSGAVPLLLDPDAPEAEERRWLERADGGLVLRVDTTSVGALGPARHAPRGTAPGAATRYGPGTVLLASSGTSGSPKLVARSLDSLRAEGRRHARWAGLTADDRVVLPLPLWHAYALGWLHACFEAGCGIRPMPPTALAAAVREIQDGATVLPLVPTVARLLVARGRRAPLRGHALRLAMVGAGGVEPELDRGFREAFGIGLARDYGSTETGSLFSAPADAAPGRVGHPLDGIRFRIVDRDGSPVAPGTTGELLVAPDTDRPDAWHATGDLADWDDDLGLRVLGRAGRAVRRGDRWVASEEIESVLRAHPDVLDARVQGVPSGTPTHGVRLDAEVVSLRGPGADMSGVRDHARDHLAPHKLPDRIRTVGALPRGSSGKVLPVRRLTPAAGAELIACAQSYKRGELLFALLRLGVIERLGREPADSAAVAEEFGLDPEACEQLLQTAENARLLRAAPAPSTGPESDVPGGVAEETLAVLRLEERLSRSWVTRERLAELGSTGLLHRAFEDEGPDEELRAVYQRAMHTSAASDRSRLGLRLAGPRPRRLLEITCGPGRYVREYADPAHARLLTTGTLAPDPTHDAPPTDPPAPGDRFDLLVVCNAIHLPGPGSDLRALAERVAPGGRLLIDDVFLDTPGGLPGEIRMDWLTHGGTAWPTEASTVAGLTAAGFTVRRAVHVGTPAVTLLVAERPADRAAGTGATA